MRWFRSNKNIAGIIISVVFHLCCSEDGICIVSLKNDSTAVAIVVILVSTLTVDDAVVNQINGTSCTLVDSSCLQIVDVRFSTI